MTTKTDSTKWGRLALPLACCVLLSGCLTRELKTGLSEQDAQEIAVVLQQNGLETRVVREASTDQNAPPRWTLKVKGGDHNLITAWRILQENGLPRQKVAGLEDVFANRGMIPTPDEEKARMLLALSGELTKTIKSLAGVVDARVQVVLPENNPLLDKAQWSPPTASVLVKFRGQQLPLSEDELRRLVAKGVEGLQPENVAIVFKRVPPSAPADVWPYLSDANAMIGALALMLMASMGALALAFRCRQQRQTITRLKGELEKPAAKPQQVAAGGARG